ncbi:hypothetical protein APHAL10511_004862 [Amanita phalloides]|nr:hypothetical protein APHAL10511_004862 [Amanita phalloides]
MKMLRRSYQQYVSHNEKVPFMSTTEHGIRKEIAIMKKCYHPNLVRLFEVIDDPKQEKIYLIMEYLSGGPVEWTNANHAPILLVDQTRRIIRDVMIGLDYLHQHGIIHRDIKPANLLWTEDRTSVKIIDFGVSHFFSDHQKASDDGNEDAILFSENDIYKRIGTPSFLAPEVVWFDMSESEGNGNISRASFSPSQETVKGGSSRKPPITKAIDIWSLAVTFYCLLFGHTPFNVPTSDNENIHRSEYTLYYQICTQNWTVDDAMGADSIKTGGRYPKDKERPQAKDNSRGTQATSLVPSQHRRSRKVVTCYIALSVLDKWPVRALPFSTFFIASSLHDFMALKAIVKSVISGDSLVLRTRAAAPGQPPKERVLYLADVTAPRLGSSTRDDEPWAFESREYLRALAVGKEITFALAHALPPNDDIPRDIGPAEIAGIDLSSDLLRNGWVKLKDLKRDPTEDDLKKREAEAEAKTAGKGLWNPHGPKARVVHHNMPTDSQAFLAEWKGKDLDGIVENVRDGTSLRIRLLMSNGDHQMLNITLAGVKSPRVAAKPGEASEPLGEEAKFFTESRLLQRPVHVQILSLPIATATPFQSNPAAAPTSVSAFIAMVLHPAGNIAEFLVAAGLVRVVDWHAGILSSSGAMERIRAAERTAKEKRAGLYANVPVVIAKSAGVASMGQARIYDGTVVRVWSGDQVSVLEKDSGKERRLQLSSTRGPKISDPKQAYYAHEAKEFLRKRLIGKHVKVTVDFIRPRDGEFEERECVTIRYGGHNANIAEQLVEKGLASAVRHKRDDEDRSPDYDKLIAAEQAAAADARGIHSGKETSVPKQPLNISETSSRAAQYLNGFKRQGRVSAIVDYVAAGSRFKVYLPKDNQTLTLVLSGIRAPRTARNLSDKSEPYGAEALEFSTRRYMQRDIEFEVETTDKTGGFIGSLYLNKTENAAIVLVKEGLATVHAYSADSLPWAKQLYDAEVEAKTAKRHIWSNYDEEAEKAAQAQTEVDETGALQPEYLDVIISDVRTRNGLSFSVQILNTEGIASLEKLMRDFSLHHQSPAAAPPNFVPRQGELVSAKFSDGAWYRAKIRRASPTKKEAEVTFIDYGNQDTVSFSNIRPLDPKFRALQGQAQDARLSFVKLPDLDSDYGKEAVDRFRALCEGRKLVANIDHREGPLLHLRLIDPSDPAAQTDSNASINADLVREGLASIDRKGCKYSKAYPQVSQKLRESVQIAKRDRAGMFEFGDVEEDEDEICQPVRQ